MCQLLTYQYLFIFIIPIIIIITVFDTSSIHRGEHLLLKSSSYSAITDSLAVLVHFRSEVTLFESNTTVFSFILSTAMKKNVMLLRSNHEFNKFEEYFDIRQTDTPLHMTEASNTLFMGFSTLYLIVDVFACSFECFSEETIWYSYSNLQLSAEFVTALEYYLQTQISRLYIAWINRSLIEKHFCCSVSYKIARWLLHTCWKVQKR